MSPSEFADVFAPLAIQLQLRDADSVTIRAYYMALKDLPLPLVQLAAAKMAKSAKWFPKTSDWREEVERIRSRRLEHQRGIIRQLREPLCSECSDTGMRLGKDNRVRRCECQQQREREVNGLRPMPKLLAASPAEIEATQQRLRKLLHDGLHGKGLKLDPKRDLVDTPTQVVNNTRTRGK